MIAELSGKGVTFKNDSRQNGGLNSNVLIIGGSGSGKTGSYIYSNLKMLNNQSAVVCDTKGLLYSAFKNELEKKGYNVSAINLVQLVCLQFGIVGGIESAIGAAVGFSFSKRLCHGV